MAFGLSAGAVGLIGAGASLVGSAMSSGAAGDAAELQAGATDRANQLSQQQFKQTRSDLAPYRGYGKAATNRLAQMLGLDLGAQQWEPGMDTPAGADDLTTWAKRIGYDTPAGRDWNDGEMNQLSQGYRDYLKSMAPAAGGQGGSSDPQYGSLLHNFTGADLQNDPGYKFGMDQGMTALDRTLARGGMMFSGAALKGAQRFGQDYAGTKFGDAFNRDASQKQQAYNFLSGGASLGQNAAAMTGNAGAQMAGQVGANTTALGNAQGAAQIAGGNAWSGGIQNAVNGYQQNQLMNKILGGNSGFGGFGAMRGDRTVPDYPGAEY